MKMLLNKQPKLSVHILLLFLLLTVSRFAFSEGTATVAPNSANLTALAMLPDRLSGSYLGCASDNRIYFNIKDFNTEKLYYGFNWQVYGGTKTNNVYIRIFNPNGTLAAGPIHLDTLSGTGFIQAFSQAIAGPNIGGAVPAGYAPKVFTPTVNGDYWIETYQSSDAGASQVATNIWSQSSYFDLTVATAANVRFDGRVHCDKWSYVAIAYPAFGTSTLGSSEPIHYAYTPEKVVMKLDFEVGFEPIAYNLAVNHYGVANSGNFVVDRRSVNSATSPTLTNGYPIFLNRPDSTVYPYAAIPNNPTLLSPIILECAPPYNLRYSIPQDGDVDLLFDLNGTPGYQQGTTDRLIELFDLSAGNNTYAWDGKNGLGILVTSGTPLTIGADLLVGRFNVPIYDAEINKGGFRITTERPLVIPNTRIFWDDSTSLPNVGASCGSAADNQNNTTGRGTNNSLIGSIIPAHAWNGNDDPTQVIPAPAVGGNDADALQCNDFGNVRVINSWGWGVKTSTTSFITLGCITLSGTVWNDLDNSAAGTFSNIFTIGETGTNAGGLFVILVDPATGLVFASVPVAANGIYTIPNVPASGINFPLLLSTTAGTVGSLPPTAGIPTGWTNTSPLQNTVTTAGVNISGLDFGVLKNVPTARRDLAATNEDISVTIPVLANDTFGKDGPSTGAITITDNANHGTATVNDGGTPNNPADDQIVYTPNTNYNGRDTLIYQICDANGDCDTAIVYITITPVNDPPIAIRDLSTTPEDTPVTVPILTNDSDIDGGIDNTSVTITDQPNHGSVVVNPGGTITYTPNLNYTGIDTLIYQVCDLGTPLPAQCDTAIVYITITPVNDPPIAIRDLSTTNEDTPVTVPILTNDSDIDGGIDNTSVTITDQPNHGSVVVNAGGTITYTPNLNYTGIDTLIYQVCDLGTPLPAQCDTAIVYITITPVNDPPIAIRDLSTTPEDTPVTVPILTNDSDIDGGIDNTSVTITDQPNHGSVIVNPGGTITYTPNLNYTGIDTLIYQVCDLGTPVPAQCDTAIVYITITPVNDPPIAIRDLSTTPEDTAVIIPILINDTDIDGGIDNASVTITDAPNHGSVIVNPGGTITYIPGLHYIGKDTLIYRVCDLGTPLPAQCDTAIVYITISAVNHLPLADADIATVPEDGNVTVPVLVNDTFGLDGPNIGAITVTQQPANGTATVNNGGTPNDPTDDQIVFTPNANYNGPDNFIYQICDANGDCDTAIVRVTVTPVNDPPIAIRDLSTTNEDTPVTIPILTNDSDIDGGIDNTSVTITDAPNHGSVVVNPGGTITYTPNLNYTGIDTLIYQVCDLGTPLPAQCDTAIVYITILPVNDPPIAIRDLSTTNEDTPVTVPILTNDSDIDGGIDNTSVTITDQPNHGSVVVNPGGTITYTPNLNYTGIDTLIYQVCDLGTPLPAQCDTAIVYITITPVNDPPIAIRDLSTTNEDTPVTVPILTNDSDIDGGIDNTSVTITDQPNHGSVIVNPGGTITYTPNANYNGIDTLIYQVCDLGTPLPAQCDTAIVYITILPVNDPPIAIRDLSTTNEDTPVTVPILTNDSDIDGGIDNTSVTIADAPNHGSVVVNPSGTITYTPNANYNGIDTLIYQVCDLGTPLPAQCDTAIVYITILPVNDPPIAIRDLSTTNEDTPVTVPILTNDSDIDGGIDNTSVTIADAPNHGSVIVNPSGTITYTPNANYNGIDTLIYQVCDLGTPLPAQCDTAIVYITILPVNDPPIAIRDLSTTNEDTPVTVPILTNDSDIDGGIDNTSVTITDAPNHGSVIVNPSGTITYTPNLNYTGIDTLIYQVCDLGTPLPAQCDTAIVYITILPVNDPPIAIRDLSTTNEDTPVTVPILTNDSDIDGGIDNTSVTITDQPNHGSVIVNPGGTITYTPNANYNGIDTLIYQVCDLGTPLPAQCDTAIVYITILPVNDPPIAIRDLATTPEDTAVIIPILINDSDVDGGIDSTSVTITDQPNHGSVIVNPDGTITYTPGIHYIGKDTLIYQVCDLGTPLPAQCDTAIVYITITLVDHLPLADADNAIVPEDGSVTVPVLVNDTFGIDGPGIGTITITQQPTNGTATVNDGGTPNDPTDDQIVYTPDPNYNGPDVLVYQICDSDGDCDTAIVRISITPVNDPPIAIVDISATDENVPVVISILTNDTDIDGGIDSTSVTITDQPNHGTVVVNVDGTITYTPAANYSGNDTLIYQVCDLGTQLPSLCDTAIVYITINPVKDTIRDTTPQNTPDTVCVNSILDGGITSTTVACAPSHGTTTVSSTGCIVYTPIKDYVGNDTLCVVVCNATNVCDTTVVIITVTPIKDTIYDTTPQNTPDTICVNSILDGGITSTTVACAPSHGTTIVSSTGCIVYTPIKDYVGNDTLCVVVCNATSVCDTTIVIITVTPIKDTIYDTTPQNTPDTVCVNSILDGGITSTTVVCAPSHGTTIVSSTGCIVYTPIKDYVGNDTLCVVVCNATNVCDTTVVIITVTPIKDTIYDTTPQNTPDTVCVNSILDGGITSTTVACAPGHGTTTVSSTGCIVYTPIKDYVGNDTLCVVICNATNVCDTTVVIITVTPIKDTIYDTTPQNTPDTICVNSILDGGITSTTVACAPSHGTTTVSSTGCIVYTPIKDYVGNDTLCVVVCNATSVCDTTVVIITVTPIKDTIYDTTPQNTPDTVCVNSILDGGITSTTVACAQSHGTTTVSSTGCIVYTPIKDYVGNDTLCVVVCNATNVCDTTVVIITVTPIKDTIYDTTPQNTPDTVCVNSILDGGITSTTVACAPSHGTTTVSSTGCIVYTPIKDYVGNDTLCVVVCNATSVCDTTIVIITVTPIKDTIYDTTPQNTPDTVCVNSILDGGITSTTVACAPSHGTTTVSSTGCIVYTPIKDYVGNDTLCVVVCNATNVCDTTVVIITVTPIKDTIYDTTPQNTPDTVCVNSILDGGITSTTVACAPGHGTTIVSSTGCIVYTPIKDYVGNDTLCVVVCNATNVCDTTVVIITVTPIKDTIYDTTPQNTPDTVCVNSILDSGIASTTVACAPGHGTTIVSSTGCIVYTPIKDYVGNDTLCVVVCNATNVCDTTVVIITVTPIKDTIYDTTPQNTPDTVCVNSILDGGITSTTVACAPGHGTTTVSSTGCIVYTPIKDYVGNDTLCVVVCSATNVCDTTVVIITVTPIKDTIYDTTPQNTPDTVCVNSILDGGITSTTVACAPSHGTTTVSSTGCIVYTPIKDYVGNDTLCVVVCNATNVCDTTVVIITVTPIKDTIYDTTPQNTPDTVCVNSILDSGIASTTVACAPGHGTTIVSSTGCIVYTPIKDYVGNDTLCVVVCNTVNICDTTVVIVTVVPVRDTIRDTLPVSTVITECDFIKPPGIVTVTACDGSTAGTAPHGTWTIDSLGCLVYTAGPVKGNDTLCIKACDNQQVPLCTETTVIITVTGVPPVAIVDSADTEINTPITISVLHNDTTYDDDPLTLCDDPAVVIQPSHGTVTVNGDGTITYTPVTGYTGIDSFEYQICDPEGRDTAWVYVNVSGVCDIPNAFSPNNDGINDVFMIPCANVDGVSFSVWNRWGIEVYRNDKYLNDWDGKYKGNPLPDGTYYYVLKYTMESGEEVNKAGFITLHR